MPGPLTLDQLTIDHFKPLLGSVFTVTAEDGQSRPITSQPISQPMTLVEVVLSPFGRRPGATRDPFSLLLAGDFAAGLPQGSYGFAAEGFDTLVFFIVPVRREGDRLIYQAVFN